jgi:uncharacterized phosphosugar-binding protein
MLRPTKSKRGPRSRASTPTAKYLAGIRRILARVAPDPIRRAARAVAASLEAGGIVHVFGTGHSSLLAQEVFYRAGGIVAINPILDPRLGFERGAVESSEFERSIEAAAELAERAGFQPGDSGIVISNSGRNALPVEMALRMKAAGLTVIALTNLRQSRASSSRHPSGKRIFEVADVILDNHCPPGDALLMIPGIRHTLGPATTVVGALILHATFLEAASALAAKGKVPASFVSANVAGVTLESIRQLTAPYQSRIRYYRPAERACESA